MKPADARASLAGRLETSRRHFDDATNRASSSALVPTPRSERDTPSATDVTARKRDDKVSESGAVVWARRRARDHDAPPGSPAAVWKLYGYRYRSMVRFLWIGRARSRRPFEVVLPHLVQRKLFVVGCRLLTGRVGSWRYTLCKVVRMRSFRRLHVAEDSREGRERAIARR